MSRQMTALERITNDLDITHRVDDGLDDSWTSPVVTAHALAALQATQHARDSHAAKYHLPSQAGLEHHHDDGTGDGFIRPHLASQTMPMGGSGTTQDTSPTMAQEVAFISGIDSGGHTVATSFWTWNNNTPATFATRSDDHKWGSSTPGTASGTVNYYFDTASSWTATEKAQMTACLTLWSDIANIHFALTTNSAAADITFHRGNDGQAVTPAGWSGTSSAGVVGGSTLWTMTDATVSIDTSVPGFGPMDGLFASIGGYVWETIEHEIGHAIGLGHGGAYNGSVNSATQQFSAFDSRQWTIMSYIDADDSGAEYASQYTVTGTNWGTAPDGYAYVPTTPMILDMLAIQGLYGASTAAAYSGGQTFGFHCNITDATEEFYDFTKNTNPVVTIWDGGTGNILDLSLWNTPETINLNPGTYSSANGETNNIGIAFGARIDVALAGHGNDTLIANSDADFLNGAGGADTFIMGANFRVDDRLNGGANNNTVILNGDYTTAMHFTGATLLNIQTVTLTAGHNYSFITNDRNITAGATLNINGGTLGAANTLAVNGVKELDGKFNIIGGAGNDIFTGGSGADRLTGGGGSDHIKGGPGADTFVYTQASDSTSTTHDLLLDFDAAADKIDLWFTVAGLSTLSTGALASNHFDANLAAAVPTLGNHQAVLFTPNSGNLAGHTILVVDANGVAGYQAGADLAIDLEAPAHPASFSLGTFV